MFSCPTCLLPFAVRLLMSAGVVLTLLSTLVVVPLPAPPPSLAALQLLLLCELDSRLPVLDSVFQNFILNPYVNTGVEFDERVSIFGQCMHFVLQIITFTATA